MFVCEGTEPLSLEEISLCSGASPEAEQPAAALCGREPSVEGQRFARTSVKPPTSRERMSGTLTERQAYRLAVEESKRAAECLVGAEEGEDAVCCQGLEPASSKDTNTLDVRANSPRNSKSSGAVSQRKGSLESTVLRKDLDTECSLSSLSESARNTQRAAAQPDTPRGAAAGSDVSNHSQLRGSGDHYAAVATPQGGGNKRKRPSADDGKEADSHDTPRSKDLQHKRAMPAAGACSGPSKAQQREELEEIQSRAAEDGSGDIRMGVEGTRDNGVEARTPLRVRTPNIADHGCKPGVLGVKEQAVKLEGYVDQLLDTSGDAEALQQESQVKQGTKRPRSLVFEDSAPQVRKVEVTDECPPSAAAGADPRRPSSAFSEATLQTGVQPARAAAKQLKVRVSLEAPEAEEEESMSRAQSTAQALAAKDEVAVEEPASPAAAKKAAKRKQPRSKPETRRGSQVPLGRRSSRSDSLANDPSLGGGSADEDYLPEGGELGEALPVAGARRPRAARTRSAAAPKQPPCPPAASAAPAASTLPRSNSRLRWSGSLGSPLGSGAAARRLRSQPLDVSCLSPDAFPPLEPLVKRPKHSPLLAACASVRQLQTQDSRLLEPGKTLGLSKPRPAWQGLEEEAALDAQLQQQSEAASRRARELHSGDIQLLDGPVPAAGMRAACDAAAQRLGQGRLGKAMRALSTAGEAAATAVPEQTGGVVLLCARVMPSCLEAACAGWTERLEAPCAGSFAETSTCIKSRAERDLQNIWDDMLARHALEAKTLQGFHHWLTPTLLDGEE